MMGGDLRNLRRVGEHLALDFSNTADRQGGRVIVEWLHAYRDVLAWSHISGVIDTEQAAQLASLAASHPDDAAQAFADAWALREAIYRAGSACAAHRPADAAALAAINARLAEGGTHRHVEAAANGFRWAWALPADARALRYPLWVVAHAAAEVLTERAPLLRECDAPDCGWLFLDTSRNHSRRWCDMRECGNRAKARRHYRRITGG
jgi:predicted RNA-binding Zn ribbon-like protein